MAPWVRDLRPFTTQAKRQGSNWFARLPLKIYILTSGAPAAAPRPPSHAVTVAQSRKTAGHPVVAGAAAAPRPPLGRRAVAFCLCRVAGRSLSPVASQICRICRICCRICRISFGRLDDEQRVVGVGPSRAHVVCARDRPAWGVMISVPKRRGRVVKAHLPPWLHLHAVAEKAPSAARHSTRSRRGRL